MASLLASTEPLSTPLQSVSSIYNFLTKLKKCRNEITNMRSRKINDSFLINLLLDQIEKHYTLSKHYENQIQHFKASIPEITCHIEITRLENEFNIFSQILIANLTQAIIDLDMEIYKLREKIEIFADIEVLFVTTNYTLTEQAGRIILTQDCDYSQYTPRYICNNRECLNWPRGIALDDNENIYVANFGSNLISVFAFTGEYLRAFGKDVLTYPWGMAVHNNSLYVTDTSALYKYTLAGELVNSVTCYGSFKIQFYNARGVHVNNKGLLFVCDRDNNCIPVFIENLAHQRTLRHESIKQSVDISTKHEQVYILTSSVLHVLSEYGTYLKQIANRCFNAHFFTLDNYNNIIISDWTSSNDTNIIILSLYINDNNIKHRLGNSSHSAGIILTNNNDIINVCTASFIDNTLTTKLQIHSL